MNEATPEQPKVGRPSGPTGRAKEARLTIVCSQAYKDKIAAKARKAGLSESNYLRGILEGVIKP